MSLGTTRCEAHDCMISITVWLLGFSVLCVLLPLTGPVSLPCLPKSLCPQPHLAALLAMAAVSVALRAWMPL